MKGVEQTNSNLQMINMYKQASYDIKSEDNKRKSNIIWRALCLKKSQAIVNLDNLLNKSKVSFRKNLSRNIFMFGHCYNPAESHRCLNFSHRNDEFNYHFKTSDYYNCDDLKYFNDHSNIYKQDHFLYDSSCLIRTYDNVNFDSYCDYSRSNSQYFTNKEIYYHGIPNNDKYSRYPSFDYDKEVHKIRCIHCGTVNTSLWRKLNKQNICNACSLYYKMHHVKRPTNLIKPEIRKRKRKSKNQSTE